MKILKKLFGGNTKIHVDEIADSTGRLLGESVIVESGSNANGTWLRLADGTQICYHRTNVTATNVARGNIFSSTTSEWVYPKPFSENPHSYSVSVLAGLSSTWGMLGDSGFNSSKLSFQAGSPVASNNPLVVGLFVIGPWK